MKRESQQNGSLADGSRDPEHEHGMRVMTRPSLLRPVVVALRVRALELLAQPGREQLRRVVLHERFGHVGRHQAAPARSSSIAPQCPSSYLSQPRPTRVGSMLLPSCRAGAGA